MDIKNGTFTSVWDGGYEITTNCKINTKSKEVFDIEMEAADNCDVLEYEYITIDGVIHPVSRDSMTEYWYQ